MRKATWLEVSIADPFCRFQLQTALREALCERRGPLAAMIEDALRLGPASDPRTDASNAKDRQPFAV